MEIKNEELGITLLLTVEEYNIGFVIYEHVGTDANGAILYESEHGKYVESVEDSEIFMHGYIKWDGCSNWHIDSQDSGMLHFCDKTEFKKIGDIMAYCWDITEEILPTFNP